MYPVTQTILLHHIVLINYITNANDQVVEAEIVYISRPIKKKKKIIQLICFKF